MNREQVLVIGAGPVGKRVAALSAQATLASRTPPQVWHAPMQTLTLRELAGQFAGQLGATPRFRVAPPWLVRVHPAMRDLRETLYSYSQPFVASDSKYTAQFGAGTRVEQAVAETLAWMGLP